MDLEEYLLNEVMIGTDKTLESLFNMALSQVFKGAYLVKINKFIYKMIHLKEVSKSREDLIAYTIGNTIYVNTDKFYSLPIKNRIRYLLHEFVHILQTKKFLFFFKRFPELDKLTNNLNKIVSKNLLTNLSVFLTGRNVNLGSGGKHEILSYLMNGSINWKGISASGKEAFMRELRQAGIFNLQHQFWKKRLS